MIMTENEMGKFVCVRELQMVEKLSLAWYGETKSSLTFQDASHRSRR